MERKVQLGHKDQKENLERLDPMETKDAQELKVQEDQMDLQEKMVK